MLKDGGKSGSVGSESDGNGMLGNVGKVGKGIPMLKDGGKSGSVGSESEGNGMLGSGMLKLQLLTAR